MRIMKQKQGFIKRVFTHNLREKFIAAFCTAVILLVAVCLKPVNRVYSVRINTKISPEQELVSSVVDQIEVKVSGNFFELRKIKNEELEMNFDFSSEKAGEISLNIGDKELPAVFLPLEVKSVYPQVLTFRTEEKKSEAAPAEQAPEEAVKESAEQEPVETFHETSPQQEQPANGDKND